MCSKRNWLNNDNLLLLITFSDYMNMVKLKLFEGRTCLINCKTNNLKPFTDRIVQILCKLLKEYCWI